MRSGARRALLILAAAVLAIPQAFTSAQTAQATLQGRVTNQATGEPVVKALVIQRNVDTNSQSYAYTNDQGFYYFPALVPGVYSVRADALGFGAEERPALELPVASKLELNFALTARGTAAAPAAGGQPAAITATKAGNILSVMYGSDAAVPQALMIDLPLQVTETLVASLSKLINERDILELPLSGRDVYSLLVLQPGVSSDNATARGLGFSVGGQRVGSSNFLLDGVDNNDVTVTGPATFLSADAVKEYRVTTNNFTAEFGRASGFIANAITRTGTNRFHGSLYEFFNHDRLNANAFSYNWQDINKPLFQRNQYGGSFSGPVFRDRLFFFANVERDRTSTRSAPQVYYVPSPYLLSVMDEESPAAELLKKFPPPSGEAIAGYKRSVQVTTAIPEQQGNTLGMGRLDFNSANGRRHFGGRYAVSQEKTENYFFSVYPDSSGPLTARGENITGNYTQDVLGGANELKFGLSRNTVRALRPHSEIPYNYLADAIYFDLSPDTLLLPGMEGDTDYSTKDSLLHIVENFSRPVGKHALGFGVEWRLGFTDSLHSAYGSGVYYWDDWADFFGNFGYDFDETVPWPAILYIPVDRFNATFPTQPNFRRYYRQQDWGGFFQDNFKLTRRFNLNLGLRYEYFGAPQARKGTVDSNFFFGPGSSIQEQIASGSIGVGLLKKSDKNNFAPRFGFSLDATGDGKNVIRGGFGIYYDRVLNNIWQNTRNNNTPVQCLTQFVPFGPWSCDVPKTNYYFDYTIPAVNGVQYSREGTLGYPVGIPVTTTQTRALRPQDVKNNSTVAVDSNLPTPYSQSWFLGFQRDLGRNLIVEVNQTGSLGRKLITADFINRFDSVPTTRTNLFGRFNPDYSEITYYAAEGHSNHVALETSVIQRLSHGAQFQLSYTYARTKDVQSDPLIVKRSTASQSDVTKKLAVTNLDAIPLFTRQFDPSLDWGNSDFDQRHNLVLNFVAQIPRTRIWRNVLGGMQVSGLVGIRSGLPFNVYSLPNFVDGGRSFPARADFLGKDLSEAFLTERKSIDGGVQLLDTSKFHAQQGAVGTLPRNALYGPGFWNADFGVSRTFRLPGEGKQLQVRTEFFNVFNHTNLGNPDENLRSSTFGEATFGRQGSSSAIAAPLTEQPRQIRAALKLYF